MSIIQLLKQTHGHGLFLTHRGSIKYAEQIIKRDENILIATAVNITTLKEKFPAILLLTNQRMIIVHKFLNIKRVLVYPYEKIDKITDNPSLVQHLVSFTIGRFHFDASLSPKVGTKFIPYLSKIPSYVAKKSTHS